MVSAQLCPPGPPQAPTYVARATGARACLWQPEQELKHLLTRAHLPLVADTGEVITLTVLARDLAKVTAVAHTLATEALTPLAAGRLALLGAALILLGGVVVLLGALAL